MDRRTFLVAAGLAGAGALLGGCAPVRSGVSRANEQPDWAQLRDKVSGGVLTPGDDGFEAAYHGVDTLYDSRTPAAVVRARTAGDVQACVDFARRAGLPVAARSGGHSYAGYSIPQDGLQVDLAGCADVEVRDDGTARIGAGARLIDVYTALAARGRCLSAGSCPTVGIAGLTLGGGIGVLSRMFGLTCDRLTAVTAVTADSKVVTAIETNDPDLYWACAAVGAETLPSRRNSSSAPSPRPT